MKRVHVFTSAACNYLPKVRVLVESIRRHHPDWVVHLALADELPPCRLADEPFDEIHPAPSLGIAGFEGWAFCHGIVELSTAIKPFLLARLLARPDCAGVVYLDPDTVLFSPLSEVQAALGGASIALTPHLTTPESGLAGVMDHEISCLKHGIYNLGFLAVAPTEVGHAFARWWAQRTYHFCRDDIGNGLFTDQRWIDLVPVFFDGVTVLRSDRLNVAPWNIAHRRIEGDAPHRLTVNGQALGFYHFTGFDSGAHRAMAASYGASQPALRRLIDWYAKQTTPRGAEPLSHLAWAYAAFDDGQLISPTARLVYRERPDLQRAFPDPFARDGYHAWWETQGRLEYPLLFDEARRESELARLKKSLTPGFGAAEAPLVGNGLGRRCRQFMQSPQYRAGVLARVWNILKAEGPAGVVARLSGRRPRLK